MWHYNDTSCNISWNRFPLETERFFLTKQQFSAEVNYSVTGKIPTSQVDNSMWKLSKLVDRSGKVYELPATT